MGTPTSQAVYGNRGGSPPGPPPQVQATDIVAGSVAAGDDWKAAAAQVHHVQPFVESLMYHFDSPACSITFTGDTDSADTVAEIAGGCDAPVVNCWNLQDRMDANGESPGQTCTADVANMVRGAATKAIVNVPVAAHVEKVYEEGGFAGPPIGT